MNGQTTPPTSQINTGPLLNQLVDVKEVHMNVSQEIVITTEDKIRICLAEYLKRIERRTSWIAPLGIFLTIILVFLTSSFNKFLLDAATWRAVFVIGGTISFIWLVVSIKDAFKSVDTKDIIEELKKGSPLKPK